MADLWEEELAALRRERDALRAWLKDHDARGPWATRRGKGPGARKGRTRRRAGARAGQ